MAYFTVNFSDVESFEPIPEGEYGVEIDKVEVRENKAGDGLYLNWELVVVDGDYENRRLWLITSLKDTALFRLKKVFEDLDVLDNEEMEIEYDDDIDPSPKEGPILLYPEVEGLEATALVKNEMYDGREQNRVREIYVERRPKKSRNRKRTVEREPEPAPSRSRRSRNDDEREVTPSRSRRRNVTDEDERPTRSRRTVRDEEYDDTPRRGRRDEEEDEDDEVEEREPRRRTTASNSRRSGPRRRIR